jgi:hypothetical protein
MFENLAAMWPNYFVRGVTHLVLARVIEAAAELDRYRTAVPGAALVVCRLVSPETTRMERLMRRMPPGSSRDWHAARSSELDEILDRLAIEDFVVENDDRSVREVAIEILELAKWVTEDQATSLTKAI